jgi:hypothetical protein
MIRTAVQTVGKSAKVMSQGTSKIFETRFLSASKLSRRKSLGRSAALAAAAAASADRPVVAGESKPARVAEVMTGCILHLPP